MYCVQTHRNLGPLWLSVFGLFWLTVFVLSVFVLHFWLSVCSDW